MKIKIEKEYRSDTPKWTIGIKISERMNYLSAMSKEQLKQLADAINKFLKENEE